MNSERDLVAILLFLCFKVLFSKRHFKTIARNQGHVVRGEEDSSVRYVGGMAGLNS